MFDFLRMTVRFLEIDSGAVTAIATIFIAVFTIVLAIVTSRQARITKIAAEAAKAAADALPILERPYIFLFGVGQIHLYDGDEGPDSEPYVKFTISNEGKTPAIVDNLRMRFSAGEDGPAVPGRVNSDHPILMSPVMKTGERREQIQTIDKTVPINLDRGGDGDKFGRPTLRGDEILYFWIVVAYRGVFPESYETSACWRFDTLSASFVLDRNESRTYTK